MDNPNDGTDPIPSSPRVHMDGLLRLISDTDVNPLHTRGINNETTAKFGYRTGYYKDKPIHAAVYYDNERQPVAAKLRFQDKTFTWLGDPKKVGLYGQHLWKDGGKMLVITEGEIDALSVSQAQGNKWPVVSIYNGAQSAKAAIQKHLEWIEKFETVVFMFDMDKHGQSAAKECAELLTPGKAKIASLSEKDANDCLTKGKTAEIINAIWQAKTFRPDGIVDAASLWDNLLASRDITATPYPYLGLTDKLGGLRAGELVTVTAGSGIGKSAFVREIAHHLIKHGERVGMVMLEENTTRTLWGLLGIELNRPLHKDRNIDSAELKQAFDYVLGSGNVYLYDHFGSTEIGNLLSRIRYMAKSLECKWVILDHLSIVVSGLDGGEDERRLIDRAMTELRTLVEETGIGLILVSHLRRPEGKGHEEGAKTSLSQLRGSHAIAQLSDAVIGLERDQQSADDANKTVVRVLKNRFAGETGEATTLYYSSETGRLTEVPIVEGDQPF
jgi:twinkle protein